MKVGFLRPSIEKDFEFFVRNLPKLEAVEFCGIAKILSVPLYKQIGMETIDPKELKEMNEEERYNLKLELMVPMDEIWEKMMDRYLELPKRRRKEINQILKDAQRGK
jgi:hypothetical protein